MQAFVNTISEGLSSEAIWGQIAPLGGFVVVLTLTAFGAYILQKNLRSARKNKGGRVG